MAHVLSFVLWERNGSNALVVLQWKRAWHSKIGVCVRACVCVCQPMTECSMVASAHHCEWNRVGSVLSTMWQQWQQPSGRLGWPCPAPYPSAAAAAAANWSLLSFFWGVTSYHSDHKEARKPRQLWLASLLWLAGWLTCWYKSRTHTCGVRASDHIKLLIWSLAHELVKWDRNTAI